MNGIDPKAFELSFNYGEFKDSLRVDKHTLRTIQYDLFEIATKLDKSLSSDVETIISSLDTMFKNMNYRNELIEPIIRYIQGKEFSKFFEKRIVN